MAHLTADSWLHCTASASQNATIGFILNEGQPLKVKLAERLQQLARIVRDRQQDSRWGGRPLYATAVCYT